MTHRAITLLAATLAASCLASPDLEAQGFDVDAWVGLAQMPVAVARLDLAGVPSREIGMLVPALNTRDVPPSLFVETVWGIPVLWGDEANGLAVAGSEPDVGTPVQDMHARGLRGRALAEAIHDELRRRGVPAGGVEGQGRRDTLHPDYLPDDWVDPRFRDDPLLRPDPRARRQGQEYGPRFFGAGPPGRPVDPGSAPAVRIEGSRENAGRRGGPPASKPDLEGKRPGRGGSAGGSA